MHNNAAAIVEYGAVPFIITNTDLHQTNIVLYKTDKTAHVAEASLEWLRDKGGLTPLIHRIAFDHVTDALLRVENSSTVLMVAPMRASAADVIDEVARMHRDCADGGEVLMYMHATYGGHAARILSHIGYIGMNMEMRWRGPSYYRISAGPNPEVTSFPPPENPC